MSDQDSVLLRKHLHLVRAIYEANDSRSQPRHMHQLRMESAA